MNRFEITQCAPAPVDELAPWHLGPKPPAVEYYCQHMGTD